MGQTLAQRLSEVTRCGVPYRVVEGKKPMTGKVDRVLDGTKPEIAMPSQDVHHPVLHILTDFYSELTDIVTSNPQSLQVMNDIYEHVTSALAKASGGVLSIEYFLEYRSGVPILKPENIELHRVYDPAMDLTHEFLLPKRTLVEGLIRNLQPNVSE